MNESGLLNNVNHLNPPRSPDPERILVLDDDYNLRTTLVDILSLQGFEPLALSKGRQALEMIAREDIAVALIDLRLGDIPGLQVLGSIKTLAPDTECILLTGHASQDTAIEAVNLGAYSYIQKPFDIDQLLVTIRRAVEKRQVKQALRDSEKRFRALIEHGADVITLLDERGLILYHSPSITSALGYAPEERIGRSSFEKLHPDDQEKISRQFQEARDNPYQSVPFEMHLLHKDGSYHTFEGTAVNLLREPAVQAIVLNYRDVTLEKQAEVDRSRSEARYRGIFEGAQDAILVESLAGDILDANPRACQMYGYTRQQLLALQVGDLVPAGYEIFMQDETGQGNLPAYPVETTNLRANGEQFPVEISGRLQYIGDQAVLLVVVHDITKRKHSEALIHRRMVELETLYDNSLAISGLADPKEIGQKITTILSQKMEWDHAAVRLYHPETDHIELVALHRPQSAPEDISRQAGRLQEMIRKPEQGLSGWVIHHGEAVRSADLAADPRYLATFDGMCSGLYVPIKSGDTTIGCISVESSVAGAFDEFDLRLLTTVAAQAAIAFENARTLMKLEQRVRERTMALMVANTELARAARLKDEFLASMSHELRTPLTGILNLSEALQEQVYGPLSEKQLKSLHTIEENGRHLLGLINDILDLSKIEAGQLTLQMETFPVGLTCQSSLQMIKQLALKKHQLVSYHLQPPALELEADPRRLKQILVNLLSNAVKFTPEGGQVGLEVSGDTDAQVVRFEVWDTGIGIAAEHFPRLFQPFTQLDSSLSRNYSGTGLGLALVQRMVDLHGGSLHVESEPGRGSRFTVTLPWSKPASVYVPASKPLAGDDSLLHPVPIATDIIQGNEQLQRSLVEVGFTPILWPGYEGAVEYGAQNHPELIILDLALADSSRWEILSALKSNPLTRGIPVIVVSAVDEWERARALGAVGYLVKPFRLVELQAALATIFRLPVHSKQALVVGQVGETPLLLLVDDNPLNVMAYADYLRAKGYRLMMASSGNEGLAIINEYKPDLVLMDIQMPRLGPDGINGIEAIQSVRRSGQILIANTPIIALTALAMFGDRDLCLAAGANAYLSKPVPLHILMQTVQENLSRRMPSDLASYPQTGLPFAGSTVEGE